MSRFKSINYSRVVCEECGETTTIEPGVEFSGLSCECGTAKLPDNADTEVSTPVQEEKDYVKTQPITVIGRFANGDYEVINSNDAIDSWRVPKDTFESTYTEHPLSLDGSYLRWNSKTEMFERVVKEKDTNEATETQTNQVTLSLNDLIGKTVEDIKDTYTLDELRVLGKAESIRGYHNMRETKLIKRLLEKVE